MSQLPYDKFVAKLESPLHIPQLLSMANLIHASLGMIGEAGEIVDIVKKAVAYNKPVDRGKVVEELGDLLHYIQMFLNHLDISMEDCIESNILKLQLRYPEGYTDSKAIGRNVQKEQEVFNKFRSI